jgi:hypothetical protein
MHQFPTSSIMSLPLQRKKYQLKSQFGNVEGVSGCLRFTLCGIAHNEIRSNQEKPLEIENRAPASKEGGIRAFCVLHVQGSEPNKEQQRRSRFVWTTSFGFAQSGKQ